MVVVCAGTLASCAHPPEIEARSVAGAARPDLSVSGQIFDAVNAYRRSHGAGNLQRHSGLDRLAQAHCDYLRKNRGKFGIYGKNVSHFGSEGRALVAREAYHMQSCSENVAATGPAEKNKASALMNLWTSSKDHEKCILNSWTHTGIGTVVDNDGTVFSTEIFATVSNSQMVNRQRFSGF